METVGSFEAKIHFAALLDRVARGQTIIIAEHGRAVARLAPHAEETTTMNVDEAIAELLKFRKAHSLGRQEIRALANEGRKY